MTIDAMNEFLELSALLTGIAATKLVPPADAGVRQRYFEAAQRQDPIVFAALLLAYRRARVQYKSDVEVADSILSRSGPAVSSLARSIMLAWYLGSWHGQADLQRYPRPALVVPGVTPACS